MLVATVLPEVEGRGGEGDDRENIVGALTKVSCDHILAPHLCAVVEDKPTVSLLILITML